MESNQRKCPECNGILTYSNKYERNRAEKNKIVCKPCSMSGEKNPFYNKKHKKETKEKISELRKGKDFYGDENKEKLRLKMTTHNPMAGKSVYDVWVKKYGKKEADKKMHELKKKHSHNNSGEKNSMFGKPSPVGSGNGWSGWYKDWYFRSLRELSYMINEIENKKKNWENGEQKKYKISYVDWNGQIRNYFPDFVVDSKQMIECKPIKLQASISVLNKKKAAEKFCEENNLEYILIEPEILSMESIKKLYIDKKLKFLPRCEEKFLKKYFK
jgi:hypothetical protein